ncbi:MAG: Kdo2-lipid lauroyltransferase/acyltransferase [Acetobacteraceae bacterium]|nr:Kdo2-lipid lauroyltransferase/acyltransferase [Acetobacteraceae bacterium]
MRQVESSPPTPAASRRVLPELRDLGIHYGLRALPTDACSAVGAWLGRTMGRRGHPAAEARVRALLPRLRPDLATSDALEAALVRLWENVGRTYAEFSVIHRMLPAGRSRLSDPALLDAVYADDRPLILCFVHLGNWELLGLQMADHPRIHRGRPIVAVTMPPTNRAHALIAARQRRVLPVDLVPMDRRIWYTIADRLRRPGGIAWLAADDVVGGRVFAPHFGRRPRIDGNLGKIVRLAAATGARILPIYSERLQGARFVSHLLPVVEVARGRRDEDSIRFDVARIDGLFAPIVQRLVQQWYMAIEFAEDLDDPTDIPCVAGTA